MEKLSRARITTPHENPGKDDTGIRRKYLIAMAVGIGVSPAAARLRADKLLKASDTFDGINYTRRFSESTPEDAVRILEVGKAYLQGAEQADQLAFAIGSRVLSVLKEDPKSGYFKSLRGWVDYFTDGDGGKKFDKVLASK